MKNAFLDGEWDSLCKRLAVCATHIGKQAGRDDEFSRQAAEFQSQQSPLSYVDLLRRVADAAELARRWQVARAQHQHDDEIVDEASDESFPASDPPSWSAAHA